jgi:hypothetical protein
VTSDDEVTSHRLLGYKSGVWGGECGVGSDLPLKRPRETQYKRLSSVGAYRRNCNACNTESTPSQHQVS